MHVNSIDVQEDGAFSRILFLGEAGEQISVRIARGDGDPVQRARAVMVQIAAFDLDPSKGADREPDSSGGAEPHSPESLPDRPGGEVASGLATPAFEHQGD